MESYMKNILARGGIEFLAVLLGITISLWVDEMRVNSNEEKQFRNDLMAIHNELESDLETMVAALAFNQDMVIKVDHLLTIMETSKIDVNALDTISFFNVSLENRSFFGKKSAYLASKSSGHFNRNSHHRIVRELTKLYDQTYSRMETNNRLIDDMMFSDNKSIYYLGHILRGNIYDKDDFYRSINSSEFYNWVVSTKNNFVHLMSVMEFTKTQMVKVESKLKKVIED